MDLGLLYSAKNECKLNFGDSFKRGIEFALAFLKILHSFVMKVHFKYSVIAVSLQCR